MVDRELRDLRGTHRCDGPHGMVGEPGLAQENARVFRSGVGGVANLEGRGGGDQ